MTYGEIEFISIAECFMFIQNKYGAFPRSSTNSGVFIDLGSGVGKAVLAASILHPFEKCIGIEIIDFCYKTSLEIKAVYETFLDKIVAVQANANIVYSNAAPLKRYVQLQHTSLDFVDPGEETTGWGHEKERKQCLW